MDQYFVYNYTGGRFELFGGTHLTALLCLLALNIYLIRQRNADERKKAIIRWTMALTLWANEIGWHYWNYAIGQWTIQTMLPLQVCSLLVWFGALGLVTKNHRIYEFMYLMGIGGAIQALVTPDLDIHGFPHYRFFQTFVSHGLVVTAAIYMTVVEGLRPTWKSLLRVALWANLYMIPIYFLNDAIGSNYLMINFKPGIKSVLHLLPPWPWYILYMEAIGILTFLLLYLPFAIKDWRTNRETSSRLDSLVK
jgi:hypothetical integral membrane protein (TIGR02206 family)